MRRKTISERLTTKYQLIVRNEQNFADKWTLSLNMAKALVFFFILLVLLFVLYFYLHKFYNFVFSGDEQLEERKALLVMMAKVDSLENELNANDRMLQGWKDMMAGGISKANDTGKTKADDLPAPLVDGADADFVKSYEKTYGVKPYANANGFTRLYFFSPLRNASIKKVVGTETELTTKNAEAAVALSAALVVSVDTARGIVVLQHKEGLITRYSNLKGIVVKEQQTVKEAQELTREQNTSIMFSMWYLTRNLKPSEYIAFKK